MKNDLQLFYRENSKKKNSFNSQNADEKCFGNDFLRDSQ